MTPSRGHAVLALVSALAIMTPLADPMRFVFASSGTALAQSSATSEKDAFAAAKELGTADAWKAFLANYPTGFNADLARAYLKKLAEAAAPPPAAQVQTAQPDNTDFPIEAGSWGGIVRSGPGQSYAKQDILDEGDDVALMGKTDEIENGYPWFKIWYGPSQLKGYMWGGILCARGIPRADVFQMCPARPEPSSKAGFCATPENATERAICANSKLSGMDAQLNSEYELALGNITSEAVGGTEADVVEFRREQNDWLKKRNQCGGEVSCLTSSYKKRLEFFKDYNQPE